MRVNLRVVFLVSFFCALAVEGTAYGQPIVVPIGRVLQIPAGAFFQATPSTAWGADSKFFLYPNSANAVELRAPVSLPSGAQVYQIGLWYYDNSATGDVQAEFWSIPCCAGGDGADGQLVESVSSTGTPGYGYQTSTPGAMNYTVNNAVDAGGSHVYVVVHLPANAQPDAAFKAVDIRYNIQVSPGPINPSFLDVPTTSPFYAYVEALKSAEITAGCGDFNYCPDSPVTRGQMAVFLAKALGLFWQ